MACRVMPYFGVPWRVMNIPCHAVSGFVGKNDPHISGSPERLTTLPQAFFLFSEKWPMGPIHPVWALAAIHPEGLDHSGPIHPRRQTAQVWLFARLAPSASGNLKFKQIQQAKIPSLGKTVFLESWASFFGPHRQHFFGVMGLFFGPIGNVFLESWAFFWDP